MLSSVLLLMLCSTAISSAGIVGLPLKYKLFGYDPF